MADRTCDTCDRLAELRLEDGREHPTAGLCGGHRAERSSPACAEWTPIMVAKLFTPGGVPMAEGKGAA